MNFKKIDQLLNQKKELPKKSVVMYFDDGFRDVYLNAYPVFKKYKLPFVIFITTDLIDQKRILPRVEKALVRTFLNWEEVREMTDLAEIGSHGKTHRDFINLTDEELRKELLISIQRIQKEIGKKPIALSCPHGKYSQRIKKLVQKTGFKFAATINKGEADVRERFGLKKIVIYSTDNMIMFKLKLGIFYKIKNLIK